MIFWILVAVLLAVAVLWIAPSLLREQQLVELDRKQQNISIARERLDEIAAEHAAGAMTDEMFEQSRSELEASLIDDVAQQDSAAAENLKTSSQYGRFAWIVLLVLMPLGTFGLYQKLGSPEYLELAGGNVGHATDVQHMASDISSMEELIERLKQRLEKNPADGEGWFLLSKTYMAQEQYALALDALQKTYEIYGDHPAILLGMADASAMLRNGDLTGEPSEYIDKALQIDPANATGLWLGGMSAQQNGKFQLAIDRWTQLMPLLAEEAESQMQVRQLLDQVISEASAKGVEVTVPEMQSAPSRRVLARVSIELPDDAVVSPENTVYIFARAASGPPMPLAAYKTTVGQLPAEIVLDDSMAMMPQMKLSAFDEVIVSARISMSGQPVAQSGDYSSDQMKMTLADNAEASLVIRHKIGDPANVPLVEVSSVAVVQEEPPVSSTNQAGSPDMSAPAIKAWVAIDAAMLEKASAQDTVYIFARASSGPPMPLAAVKATVADLPMEVTLDDSMAMMPQMRLSAFDEVVVSARVSKNGAPRAMPGDLTSQSKTVQLSGVVGVELTISEVIQ